MAQLPENISLRREEVEPEIPGIIFSLTKNEEEIVQSIAKTLAVEVPFFNLDDDKIKISDDFQTDSNEAQDIASDVELVVTEKEIEEISGQENIVRGIQLNLERSGNEAKTSEACFDRQGGKSIDPLQKDSSENVCKYCGDTFVTVSALKTHEIDHSRDKLHTCPFCSKTFHEASHVTKHNCMHAGGRPFMCGLCKDTFDTDSALKSHTASHSEAKQGTKEQQCPVCRATFSNRAQLRIHKKKHEEKIYKCSDCGDKFLTIHRLKRHNMIHTGERRFQCEECGVAFREDATLRTHMGIHLPRGPYPCDICGEVFPRLNSLALHKKVHNTNGAYKYVPWRKGGIYVSSFAGDSGPKNCILEVSEPTDGCLSTKNTSLNTNTALGSVSSDPLATTPNPQQPVLDSEFSNTPHPPNDISVGKADMVGDEKEAIQINNTPHPDVVRDALSTGMVLESQAEDGQVYFIVLPKALAEKDYTLLTFPPVPSSKIPMMTEPVMLQDSEELGHNSCDLLMWDNDLNAVAEVNFHPEQTLLSSSTELNKKLKQPKLSDIEETVVSGESDRRNTNTTQKKEKKVKEKKPQMPRSFECQLCGKDCKTSSSFVIHMRSHTGERPYYCDYCSQGFKQVAHLRAHIRIHTGEAPFKCKMCDAAFKQSSRLKAHVKIHHIEGKIKKKTVKKPCKLVRNFYCKICDKTFLDSCYKIQHMKTHADERQYICEKCGAAFKNKLSLGRHSKVHAGEHPGICAVCGLKFKNLEALNFHMAKSHDVSIPASEEEISERRKCDEHVSESVFSPDTVQLNQSHGSRQVNVQCKETVIDKQNDSTPVSSKVRLYNCTTCGKSFKKRTNLTVHMRMHTDERPYKCNDCCSAFRQISHLKDHAKVHTGEKPFKCSACLAAFCQSSAAKYHIKTKHRGKAGVIKVEKNIQLKDEQESITLENASDLVSETVVIKIESGLSSSDVCKIFGDRSKTVKDESQEDGLRIRKTNCSFSADLNSFESKRKCVNKCKVCNKQTRKTGNRISPKETGGGDTWCAQKRCKGHKKASKSHTSVVELTEADKRGVKIEESDTEFEGGNIKAEDRNVQKSITKVPEPKHKLSRSSLKTAMNKNSIATKEEKIFSKSGNSGECEIALSGLEENAGTLRQYEGLGNVCGVCGKAFRRASALKFHQQMSHNNIDEDGEEDEG